MNAVTQQREQLLLSADAMKADVQLCESLDLQPNEDREIAATIDRISRIEQVRSAVATSLAALSSDESDMSSALSIAAKSLEHALPDDPQILLIVSRLENFKNEVNELVSEISGINEGLDVDADELDSLMLRQRQIRSLLLRHGPEVTDVLDWVQTSKRQLELIDPDGSAIIELQRLVEQARLEMHQSPSSVLI